MSSQMQPPNPPSLVQMPAKRKRGRPRKDEGQQRHQVERPLQKLPVMPAATSAFQLQRSAAVPSPYFDEGKQCVGADQAGHSNNSCDEMVGQVVTGIVESVFDAGYLLTVKVGDTYMRGVVFHDEKIVPITPEEDIAPNLKMYHRQKFSTTLLDSQIEKQDGQGCSSGWPMSDSQNVQEKQQGWVSVPDPAVSPPEPGPNRPPGLEKNIQELPMNDHGIQDQGRMEPPKDLRQKNEVQNDDRRDEDIMMEVVCEPEVACFNKSKQNIVAQEGESLVEEEGKVISPDGGNNEAQEAENVVSRMPVGQQEETLMEHDGVAENGLLNKGDECKLSEQVGDELKEMLPRSQMEKATETRTGNAEDALNFPSGTMDGHADLPNEDKPGKAITDILTNTDLNEPLIEPEAEQASAPDGPRLGLGRDAYGDSGSGGIGLEPMDCE